MNPAKFFAIAAELRTRAAKASGKERIDLLFLASEYEILAANADRPDGAGVPVVIPH